jgi:tetratricopeptide (TPR) repeat protein
MRPVNDAGHGSVSCYERQIILPTYPAQDADPNPMFLEKRVYQGSSGSVYPNPFTDRVALEPKNKSYRAIFLENQFVQLMILPEIGGRIHTATDKTNQYDFFYRQQVIKPALVGLLGPWISGGVEFNWPQHHRPSTFMPVHAAIENDAEGGCTVWLSEHDPMLRMKGMVGIRLAPGRSIIEARVRLFNRTSLPQSFLWWANVAVRVHDQYQSFFPPDVSFVADHAKRAISSFPIARNLYYGVDYRPGTDISWYKNIPVPTSYMVTESKYDFFGGYDHARRAGVIHTSNHHIAPGKKMWTWGNAEFGYAWDRNLTDEDGPYVELMAGAYTDNQPDFSWLQPFETKTFSQYWYPIQEIGPAKNANAEVALNLEISDGRVFAGVCVTSQRSVRILLACNGSSLLDERVELAPGKPFTRSIQAPSTDPTAFRIAVAAADGRELLAWQPESSPGRDLPNPATEPPPPSQIESIEELYLTGLHLEQYRHATRSPEAYWREGLLREPQDARLNNAMGLAMLRKGVFREAEQNFTRAVHRVTFRNSNPYDGEPYYNLGLARIYQGNTAEAYAAFHKAVWNYAWVSAGYYWLAAISLSRGDLDLALEQVDRSLQTNTPNLNALALKASILRLIGRTPDAQALVNESLILDPLSFRLLAERFLLSHDQADFDTFTRLLEADIQTLLDVIYELAWSGLRPDALLLLEAAESGHLDHPMLGYTLAWIAAGLGRAAEAQTAIERAESASPLYCFPARLEEMIVLEHTIAQRPGAARAHYYLGNLYYHKRRYDGAIRCWRRSVELDPCYSIPWRNLGLAEFNILHNPERADQMYARAFSANPGDARLLYEWDQLKKRAGLAAPLDRLRNLDEHAPLVAHRDDLMLEYITLLNQAGRSADALLALNSRRFSPWEGGEGLVPAQFITAQKSLGYADLLSGHAEQALQHFEAARHYPENLGEGKHLLTLERDLDYLCGIAADRLGNASLAQRYWQSAAASLPSIGYHSFFQAMALFRLGDAQQARAILSELAGFARTQSTTEPKIDYFATSLPNFLLFEDDLYKRNRIECTFLTALAHLGFGETESAARELHRVLSEDPNHPAALEILSWMNSGFPFAPATIDTESLR